MAAVVSVALSGPGYAIEIIGLSNWRDEIHLQNACLANEFSCGESFRGAPLLSVRYPVREIVIDTKKQLGSTC
jgi:hypothetical protein